MNRVFQILILTFTNPIKLWKDELEQKLNVEDFYLKKVIVYNFFIAVLYLFVNIAYVKKYQINEVNNLFSISFMLMVIATLNIILRATIFNILCSFFTQSRDFLKSSMLIFYSSIPISIIFITSSIENISILKWFLYIYYIFLLWKGINIFFTIKRKNHIYLFVSYLIFEHLIHAILFYYLEK